VIKFNLDTKAYGLLIKPKEPDGPNWDLVMYTDSDCAGDKDNRISVTGFIYRLKGTGTFENIDRTMEMVNGTYR
jgi:hypothetical protein